MSDFNTFTGKTVDEAIGEACRFFATERDRLEVEILSGGSTGIFGLVGKKKAQVRARRRHDPALAALLREEERQAEAAKDKAAKAKAEERSRTAAQVSGAQTPAAQAPVAVETAFEEAEAAQTANQAGEAADENTGQPRERGRRQRDGRRDRPRRPREAGPSNGDQSIDQSMEGRLVEGRQERQPRDNGGRPKPERNGSGRTAGQDKPGADASGQDKAAAERQRAEKPRQAPRPRREAGDDDLPEGHDTSPASPELIALASEIMTRLLTPILEQEPKMEIEGTASRLNVLIQDEEHSGLLIGREGQTLAALQYLANRIMARRWESPVRVQVNTGEYREKQDDNLRKMAAFLADKARNLGRPQSTKPLSSYHRRVIHLALQGDETIQTRSKGDGPMKRVIIVPKRPKPEPQATQ